MNLNAAETILTGAWVNVGGTLEKDDVCRRIEWLLEHVLQKIAASPQWGDWETLYRDPSDGRYWEKTYPHGELHGGGPPQLSVISAEVAREKYQI